MLSSVRRATVLALMSSLSCVAYAQEDTTLIQSLTIRVNPGMNQQFEEAVRAVAGAARETGSTTYWLAAQSVSGEPVYTINRFVSDWSGFGAADGPQLVEVYGEEEAARIGRLFRDSVASTTSAFYTGRNDLSHTPPPGSGPPDAIITFFITVNPGRMQDYIEVTEKTSEASAAIEPEAYFTVALPDFGADAAMTTAFIQSWSDLDEQLVPLQQRIVRHFGEEEGGRINALAGEVIGGFEAVLHRTRPDLGYFPAPQD